MKQISLVEQMLPTPVLESFWRQGQSIDIFVPMYFSAQLSDNDGSLTTREWLEKLDEQFGGNVVEEVQRLADAQAGDKENEDGANPGRDSRRDRDVDEDAFDTAFGEYVKEMGGYEMGGYERFRRDYEQKKTPASEFEFEEGGPELEEVLKAAKEDWNESAADLTKYGQEDCPGLKSLTVVDVGQCDKSKPQDVGILLKATFDTPPDDATTKALLEYVSGQMSDGWGEGFEQRDWSSGGGALMDYAFHFYANGGGPRAGARTPIPSGLQQGAGKVVAGAKNLIRGKVGEPINRVKKAVGKFGGEAKRRVGKAARALRGESVAEQLVNRLVE